MSLETKSIHELRGIAQAVGVPFKWGDSRLELLQAIEAKATRALAPADPVKRAGI